MPYIYQAALWCDKCGRNIRERLDTEGHAPEHPNDECTYDSDDYPKYADNSGESDCPDHCDAGEDCINATILSDGTKIGELLTEELTSVGRDYVQQAVNDGGLCAVEVWGPAFDIYPQDEDEDED